MELTWAARSGVPPTTCSLEHKRPRLGSGDRGGSNVKRRGGGGFGCIHAGYNPVASLAVVRDEIGDLGQNSPRASLHVGARHDRGREHLGRREFEPGIEPAGSLGHGFLWELDALLRQ